MSADVLQHIPALRAYLRAWCRNIPDAEDPVQETLLRAVEHAAQYRQGANMRARLFAIMRNRFPTNCRKSARERPGAADCVSILAPARVPAGQEWHMHMVDMQAVLRDMPVHYRGAIILVGAPGESCLDAARISGCDTGTVRNRVNRARALLREGLEPA